ncbi:MAG: hypothetical protein J6X55_01500 [Victivallales bacterium]|nr:hypothetical protein [Victivallales bacterium]
MSGQIKGMGAAIANHLTPVTRKMFDGGFVTSGHTITQSISPAAEGEAEDNVAKIQLTYATLPDDATVVVIQRAVSLNRFYFRTVKGFGLNVPNGVQNGETRQLECELLPPMSLREKPYCGEMLVCGSWLNIDGRLGVRSFKGPLMLNRPYRPNVTIRSINQLYERSGGQSYTEEICAGQCLDEAYPRQYEPGEVLFDIACAVRVNISAEKTRAWEREFIPEGIVACCDCPQDLRKVIVRGADDKVYVVLFNAGDKELQVNVKSQLVTLKAEESVVLKG